MQFIGTLPGLKLFTKSAACGRLTSSARMLPHRLPLQEKRTQRIDNPLGQAAPPTTYDLRSGQVDPQMPRPPNAHWSWFWLTFGASSSSAYCLETLHPLQKRFPETGS